MSSGVTSWVGMKSGSREPLVHLSRKVVADESRAVVGIILAEADWRMPAHGGQRLPYAMLAAVPYGARIIPSLAMSVAGSVSSSVSREEFPPWDMRVPFLDCSEPVPAPRNNRFGPGIPTRAYRVVAEGHGVLTKMVKDVAKDVAMACQNSGLCIIFDWK